MGKVREALVAPRTMRLVAIGVQANGETRLLPVMAVKFENATGQDRTTLAPLRAISKGGTAG